MRIRGHHLLCLQGFRGLGYNEEFIRRMGDVTRCLAGEPNCPIEPITAPDMICEVCPHNRDGRRKTAKATSTGWRPGKELHY